jgi:hypothetical protein
LSAKPVCRSKAGFFARAFYRHSRAMGRLFLRHAVIIRERETFDY